MLASIVPIVCVDKNRQMQDWQMQDRQMQD